MRTIDHKLKHLKIQFDMDKVEGGTPIMKDEWEQGFLTSIFEQVEIRGSGSLSEKQITKIHEIYDKYFEA